MHASGSASATDAELPEQADRIDVDLVVSGAARAREAAAGALVSPRAADDGRPMHACGEVKDSPNVSAPPGRTMLPLQEKAGSPPPIVAAQSMWIIPTRRLGFEAVQISFVTTAMSPLEIETGMPWRSVVRGGLSMKCVTACSSRKRTCAPGLRHRPRRSTPWRSAGTLPRPRSRRRARSPTP